MTVRWLVDKKKGHCFWGSMAMLIGYHRRRLGLPSVPTQVDHLAQSQGPFTGLMRRDQVQQKVDKYGLRWAYVPLREEQLEQMLSQYGPLLYASKLYPNSDYEHTVVITGIESHPDGPIIVFNDPGSGDEGRLPLKSLFEEHPPLFEANEGGIKKSAFVFYSRTLPEPLRVLPQPRGTLFPRLQVPSDGSLDRRKAIQAGRYGQIGTRPGYTPRPAFNLTTWPSPTYRDPLRTAASTLRAGGPTMQPGTTYSNIHTRKTYQVDALGKHRQIGAMQQSEAQLGLGITAQQIRAHYDPIRKAAESLRPRYTNLPRTAAQPMLAGTTYSNIYTGKSYKVDAFGQHRQIGSRYGLGYMAQNLWPRA